jgi:hypothetical protein
VEDTPNSDALAVIQGEVHATAPRAQCSGEMSVNVADISSEDAKRMLLDEAERSAPVEKPREPALPGMSLDDVKKQSAIEKHKLIHFLEMAELAGWFSMLLLGAVVITVALMVSGGFYIYHLIKDPAWLALHPGFCKLVEHCFTAGVGAFFLTQYGKKVKDARKRLETGKENSDDDDD